MTPQTSSITEPKRQELDAFIRGRIIGQWEKDATYREISKALDIPKSTVGNVVKVFRDKGVSKPLTRLVREPNVTKRTQSAMVRLFHSELFLSIAAQHQRLVDAKISICMTIFHKNMELLGFNSHLAAPKSGFIEKHKKTRLKWCLYKYFYEHYFLRGLFRERHKDYALAITPYVFGCHKLIPML
ncbi:Homeodomain-like DNA binding domain-containing transcription factor [Phycomyces blakesleeanus NRRL 1555(-)]|uniref:Homeodomain-like DNA binding domain-containing transcription factor n=1 Tax=Phycomyces blakesleeanus (strain ATCC 8743b / DSM 1359 / FGSC 10004 / NBRC 33097 / NRRL 1555) TaxID=763407 RepID=A0A167LHN4_PHYB8|nr:Homeodomain-like DNA binding domain-containing transcription factor [Phycomyces blakesleeanus NRRL 1555(-)]OAD70479.1 Homeodomain-like DNA binding domain-containing transcription factor [Phycomyces blakesleeanus NRRL 1555(-)]|eukprot:XP_018288519.1 Homeodomain-like DNA binding domain-containing transcription factor [Phycomyces blakesleeanus NRRL 1555(-)]